MVSSLGPKYIPYSYMDPLGHQPHYPSACATIPAVSLLVFSHTRYCNWVHRSLSISPRALICNLIQEYFSKGLSGQPRSAFQAENINPQPSTLHPKSLQTCGIAKTLQCGREFP